MTRNKTRRIRDSKGRFVSEKRTAFIDEFGNGAPNKDGGREERYFGYVVTVTDKPHAFGRLSRRNRERSSWRKRVQDNGGVVKTHGDTVSNKYRMTYEIRQLEPDVCAYYIDKDDDSPEGWDTEKDGSNNRVRTLDYVIGETVDEYDEDLRFVVDHHSSYKKGIVSKICSKYSGEHKITGDSYSSTKSEYADHLQTQDYATNAARSKLIEYPFRAWMLRMKSKKLDGRVKLPKETKNKH